MIKQLLKLRTFLVHIKIYINRVFSYLSIFNSCMIIYLFIAKLEDQQILKGITKYTIPLFILIFVLIVLFGYLEDKLGLFREEQRVSASRNQYFLNISTNLEKLNKDGKKTRSPKTRDYRIRTI